MPPLGKLRQFEVLRQVLAMAEEQQRVPLTDAAAAVGLSPEQLKQLLDPVLFLAFRTSNDELIDESRGFLFTDDGSLTVDERHWLRDLAGDPPSPDVALRLLVAGMTMQGLATEPTPELDTAVDKLSGVVGAHLEVSVPKPPALEAARQSWTLGRSLCFRYVRDNDDHATSREVLPYRVYGKWSRWYVQGRELDEATPKTFRVDRMYEARLGDFEFDPPPDTQIPEWFDLSEHERRLTLRLRREQLDALPRPARVVAQQDIADGRVDAEVVVMGERRLDHLLVTLDPDVEILAPLDARTRQREQAAALLHTYS
jgi:predicted DNA-binding transcriptional regulator YafY